MGNVLSLPKQTEWANSADPYHECSIMCFHRDVAERNFSGLSRPPGWFPTLTSGQKWNENISPRPLKDCTDRLWGVVSHLIILILSPALWKTSCVVRVPKKPWKGSSWNGCDCWWAQLDPLHFAYWPRYLRCSTSTKSHFTLFILVNYFYFNHKFYFSHLVSV